MLVMVSLFVVSCMLQMFSGSIKNHVQMGLEFLNPLMNSAMDRTLNPTQNKIYWESRFLAKHQEEGGLSSGLMGSGIITIQKLGQTAVPVSLSRHWQSAQQVVVGAIKSLALTISSLVVWGSARFNKAIQAAKLLDQGAFKIASLIRV